MRASPLLGFLLFSSFSFLLLPARAEPPPLSGARRRALLEFKETKGNASFECSPSGPCVPCFYSEKKDNKYRCSETGYRVPLNCIEIQESSKETVKSKPRRLYSVVDHGVDAVVDNGLLTVIRKLKSRRLLDDSPVSEGGKKSYVTYRSCVPMEGEEKLSVIGFEMIMVGLLLISGPVVYMRQRRTSVMPGAVRIPSTSPRF